MSIINRLVQGTVLNEGRFEVKRLVKSGGMGAVYEVADRNLNNKTYALKEMRNLGGDAAERLAARDRFISEVQVMMSLRHPNIPRVTASFLHEGALYFVMELIEGTDLSQVLKDRGNPGLPAEDVINWGLQILDALSYTHSLTPAVVHRDIKPSNMILRERDGRVLLIDFGISRVTNPGEGLWIGTPGYAPAEQQEGRPEPASDLYALAATMHELLSGRRPKDFDFPAFDKLGVSIDRELEAVLMAALEPWPEDRTASAQEMSAQLRKLSNFSVRLPEVGRDHDFEAAVHDYKTTILDPLLRDLILRYGNECHTPYLPKNLDYLQFTLACPTPYELLIAKDADRERIRFSEKQGILDAHLLGEINPLDGMDAKRTRALIEQFVENYENFKNANGMLMM